MMTAGKMSRREAEEYIKSRFQSAGLDSPRYETRLLADHLECDGLCDKTETEAAVNRRINSEPLQYILGEWEFFSLPFVCGEGVLIPRPDTEALCEKAIEFLGSEEKSCIDLCSGTGCVAVSIAEHCKNAEVYALEKYDKAYEYLEKNISLNRSRVIPLKGDLFFPTDGKYDLIVSNPPYIASDKLSSLQKEVRFEPMTALDGGADGLLFYRAIAELWVPKLKSGGMLAVEVGYDQSEAVKRIFSDVGLKNVGTYRDLCKIERVVFGTFFDI